jgi:hypothetical protein
MKLQQNINRARNTSHKQSTPVYNNAGYKNSLDITTVLNVFFWISYQIVAIDRAFLVLDLRMPRLLNEGFEKST